MLRNRILAPILVALMIGAIAVLVPAQLQANAPAVATASVVSRQLGEQSLSFRLDIPAPAIADGVVTIDGLAQTSAEPGAPRLPIYTTLIALPPEAHATVEVRALTSRTEPSAAQVAFNPQRDALSVDVLETMLDEAPDLDSLALRWEPDPAIYGAATSYPQELYSISEPIYYRDVRLARLTLFPVRFEPAGNHVTWSPSLQVTVRFDGANLANARPLPGSAGTLLAGLTDDVLNFEQIAGWRSLPADFEPQATTFPIGVQTFKIEIDADGIYELTYTDLQAAGMPVASVDPGTFEMMFQGAPLAYQFIGNADATFDPGEAVRFYGWAFDGPRREDDYVGNNIYWLWAGGTPTLVDETPSSGGSLPTATSFPTQARLDPINFMFSSWTNEWELFDNEPDQFFMELLTQSSTGQTWDYEIELVHPDTAAAPALVRAELLSLNPLKDGDGAEIPKQWQVTINGATTTEIREWNSPSRLRFDADVTSQIDSTNLVSGTNTLTLTGLTDIASANSGLPEKLYLNEFTVDYQRLFRAVGDELIFSHAGQHTFNVTDFSVDQVVVWDISDRQNPDQVTGVGTSGSAGDYTVSFKSATVGDTSFVVTSAANIGARSPAVISTYTAPSIDAAGGADWLAITYTSFWNATQSLATHRTNPLYGGLSTKLVNVQDVYNQYGYGYAYPQAIKDYLAHIFDPVDGWPTVPSYLLLVGDANVNMQGVDVSNYVWWDPDEPNYVITDLVWEDRYQGMVPSDHTFATVVGDDLLAELAVGRLPVQSATEAADAVGKIIQYELNHTAPVNYNWLQNIVYVADRFDPTAGDFCNENVDTATLVPDAFSEHHLCLDDYATAEALRADMSTIINGTGASLLLYRGHGSVDRWSGAKILSTDATGIGFWDNADLPVVILSMDCLDSNFTFPGWESLAETLVGYADGSVSEGSAGQWSSTGLGFTFEHRALARELMAGVFEQGLTAIGDAILYSKALYYAGPYLPAGESELYTFTLHGDPALQLFRPDLAVTKSTAVDEAALGELVDYTITVENNGLYPSHVQVTDLLPAGMTYITHTATTTTTVSSLVPLVIDIHTADPTNHYPDAGLAYGASETITLTVRIDANGVLVNSAAVAGGGLDLDLSDNAVDADALLVPWRLHVPALYYR